MSTYFGADQKPQRALMIRVRNIPQLAAKEGGKVGELAVKYAPDTIEAEAYGKMQRQFSSQLAERGVAADVQVVDTANMHFETSSPIWKYTAIGLLSLIGVGATWKLVNWVRR